MKSENIRRKKCVNEGEKQARSRLDSMINHLASNQSYGAAILPAYWVTGELSSQDQGAKIRESK